MINIRYPSINQSINQSNLLGQKNHKYQFSSEGFTICTLQHPQPLNLDMTESRVEEVGEEEITEIEEPTDLSGIQQADPIKENKKEAVNMD